MNMKDTMIDDIGRSCSCDERQAQEYLDREVRTLCELRDAGSLRYDNLEEACTALGIETDNIEFLLETIMY